MTDILKSVAPRLDRGVQTTPKNDSLRVYEHKNKQVDGFTQKYNVNKLVYYEHTTDVYAAIAREKQIKKWRREKKNCLVTLMNPTWEELTF